MKLATGILILGMGLGTAVAQSPSVIDSTKAKLTAVQQQKTADINAALPASHRLSAEGQTPSASKPAAAPAKPAAAKSATVATAQPASQAPAANKSSSASASKQPAPAASQK